jgi:hypothetical protein
MRGMADYETIGWSDGEIAFKHRHGDDWIAMDEVSREHKPKVGHARPRYLLEYRCPACEHVLRYEVPYPPGSLT